MQGKRCNSRDTCSRNTLKNTGHDVLSLKNGDTMTIGLNAFPVGRNGWRGYLKSSMIVINVQNTEEGSSHCDLAGYGPIVVSVRMWV